MSQGLPTNGYQRHWTSDDACRALRRRSIPLHQGARAAERGGWVVTPSTEIFLLYSLFLPFFLPFFSSFLPSLFFTSFLPSFLFFPFFSFQIIFISSFFSTDPLRQVTVEVEGMDKGGNFIGWCFVDGLNLSVALVEEVCRFHPASSYCF